MDFRLNLSSRRLRIWLKHLPGVPFVYRFIRDQFDRSQPFLPTTWGFMLAGHPQMALGSFEPEETRCVRQFLGGVDVFVNVGANVGYYCCHALQLGCRVIAFEPIARNLHYLLANIETNGWSHLVEIFPVALGSHAGILPMWGGGTGASLVAGWASIPAADVSRVPVLTMDRALGAALHGQRVLILMDVEGAELSVLNGASHILFLNPKPIWIVEIMAVENRPNGFNPDFINTFAKFFEAGYRCFSVADLESELSMEKVRGMANGIIEIPGHNFVFMG